MRVSVQTFWLPKAGNSADEYEDAFWPAEEVAEAETERFRCAVADGATEASFSAIWAGLLARGYCQASLKAFLTGLPLLQQAWRRQVGTKPLPWYAEEKARKGAFATLLGLTVWRTPPNREGFARWEAVAVGDSCLFQIRDGQPIAAFPLTHSEQFNSRPFLLGTNPLSNAALDDNAFLLRGKGEPGDTLALMTDALACWFLRCQEETGDAWERLSELTTQAAFTEFIHHQRSLSDAEGRPILRNDDVTLLRLTI